MKPLLLLHGALGSKNEMLLLQQALVTEGFVVFTMNFSGHGGSPFKKTFDIETFAQDVLEFLDKNNLKQADVFGYSMGGYVATWLVVNHPDRINKIITLGTKYQWSVAIAQKEILKLDPEKVIEKVPAFAKVLEESQAPNNWKEVMKKTSAMMLSLGDKPLLTGEVLQEIHHDILILLGDKDDTVERNHAIQIAGIMLNAEFTLLENTPHAVEKISLKVIVPIIEAFLKH